MDDQIKLMTEDQVKLIEGGIAVDDRGQIQFCNDFDFTDVRRFYTVSNHKQGFIRAWHGHKNESKYAFVVSGAAIISAVKIDNWDNPNKNAEVHRFVLSEKKPSILQIPKGHANGFKTLLPDTKVMFFSCSAIEESLNDDIRFAWDYWNPWDVEYR